MKIKSLYVIAVLACAGWAIGGGAAFAANQSVTQTVAANIAFDTALTITKNADINFGKVKASVVNATYAINTAGVITPGGGGALLFGAPVVGDLTIAGSSTQAINISVGNFVASNGVTASVARCAYNGGAEQACSYAATTAPGAGKHLLLGVTVTADGTQTAGTAAAPTLDVTVIYN